MSKNRRSKDGSRTFKTWSELGCTKKSWFQRLTDGLKKTGQNISDRMEEMLKGYAKIDEDLFMDLEDILVGADVGVEMTMSVVDELRDRVRTGGIKEPSEIRDVLKAILIERLESVDGGEAIAETSPSVVLVVGVNGVGKTTTIGKMAANLKNEGKKVLMVAGDTFRAAAVDQLKEWSKRAEVDIIAQPEGSDPASVVFDAIASAKAKAYDVLLCDTAGRLHNKRIL